MCNRTRKRVAGWQQGGAQLQHLTQVPVLCYLVCPFTAFAARLTPDVGLALAALPLEPALGAALLASR
jgi:hypothetical protein